MTNPFALSFYSNPYLLITFFIFLWSIYVLKVGSFMTASSYYATHDQLFRIGTIRETSFIFFSFQLAYITTVRHNFLIRFCKLSFLLAIAMCFTKLLQGWLTYLLPQASITHFEMKRLNRHWKKRLSKSSSFSLHNTQLA